MTFDTPVADYLPQLANPVVVDSLSTTKTTFRPAKTVLTVKHLFNFTSGLFYPQDEDMARGNLNQGYHSKAIHASEDPLTEWFSLLKVCVYICDAKQRPNHKLSGRPAWRSVEVRTWDRLCVINNIPLQNLAYHKSAKVVYGWSSDILGFVIEKVSGQSLESFLYVRSSTNPIFRSKSNCLYSLARRISSNR